MFALILGAFFCFAEGANLVTWAIRRNDDESVASVFWACHWFLCSFCLAVLAFGVAYHHASIRD